MKDLHDISRPVRSVLPWRSTPEADAEASTEEQSRETPSLPSDLRPDLLTNEEQIRYLLESVDGVARQTALVEAGDWSKSTVSRVLCRMEEDGSVVRYMIGGRNVVYLPGREPEALTADPLEDRIDDR